MIAYCRVIEAAGGKVHVNPFETYAFGKHSVLFCISEKQVPGNLHLFFTGL